jgi:hypothetical protein
LTPLATVTSWIGQDIINPSPSTAWPPPPPPIASRAAPSARSSAWSSAPRSALGLAFIADTLSITIMEIVDNGIMLAIPGAMDAHLDNALFWGSLAVSLAIAWVAAFPVNRWLISRGRGHAVIHSHH